MAGVLVGGAGAALQLDKPAGVAADVDYPAGTRTEAADRASRGDARTPPTATPTPTPSATRKPSPRPTTSQPSGGGSVISSGSCEASYYDEPQGTANGETFDPEAYTAAHRSLPFDSRVRVTNIANGRSVIVRINDRGPFVTGRCLDLSRAAFRAIASLSAGVADVRYEVLG